MVYCKGGISLKTLYIKQHIMALSEKFTISNARDEVIYFAQGSFMKVPKTFTIENENHKEVAFITKKILSLFPTFEVEVEGKQVAVIRKEFSLFKAKYQIEGQGLQVEGNWWDMDFAVRKDGHVIGEVHKQWFKVRDTYEIQIADEAYELILVAIVLAIDRVKASENTANNTASF